MLTTIIGWGAAGLLLLFLEMFLPGMIAGIIGAVLLMVSVSKAYEFYGAEGGNIALLIAVSATSVLWWWWATHFQNTRLGRSMTLQHTGSGSSITLDHSGLVGSLGTALTTLRPSGTVRIGGKNLDANCDGQFIEAGTAIRIIRSQGSSVIVQRASL